MKRPSLHWRIVTVLLVVSLMPIGLMGIGVWVVFGRLLEEKAFEMLEQVL